MKFLLVSILTVFTTAAFGQYKCPAHMRYAPNNTGQKYCVFENITLPDSGNPRAYCEYLADGYIGFVWDIDSENAEYNCPNGMRQTTNDNGEGACLLENLSVPNGAQPYCEYLSDGYVGFTW